MARYSFETKDEITGCANCSMAYREKYYGWAFGCRGLNDLNPCVRPDVRPDRPFTDGSFIPEWCPLTQLLGGGSDG